jgi:hypothetical protein
MYDKPIIYKRPVPRGFKKQELKLVKEVKTGSIIEFVYGSKQKVGQVGGYKNDRRPVLLVFYDDGKKYIEGLNTNYLSRYYLFKLNQIRKRFPGILVDKANNKTGEMFYKIVKRTAPYAVGKGYRKYMRKSLKSTFLYVLNELDK